VLRGELHIVLSELIDLSQPDEESSRKVISVEQTKQRTDRAERMAVLCCDILDIILEFLVGNEEISELSSPNSRIWEDLPFQSLLDLQKVSAMFLIVLFSHLNVMAKN
jgi:hypothetical protein